MTQTLPRVQWKTSMRDAPDDRRKPPSVTTGARSRNTTGLEPHSPADLYNVRFNVSLLSHSFLLLIIWETDICFYYWPASDWLAASVKIFRQLKHLLTTKSFFFSGFTHLKSDGYLTQIQLQHISHLIIYLINTKYI